MGATEPARPAMSGFIEPLKGGSLEIGSMFKNGLPSFSVEYLFVIKEYKSNGNSVFLAEM